MTVIPLMARKKLVDHLAEKKVIGIELADTFGSLDASNLLQKLWKLSEVDQSLLAEVIAEYVNLPFIKNADLIVSDDVQELLSYFDHESLPMLPIKKLNDSVFVAISDPFDIDLKERLESLIDSRVMLGVAEVSSISRVIQEKSGSVSRLVKLSNKLTENAQNDNAESVKDKYKIDENSAPVVGLVNTLLREAVAKKVSDIHIEKELGKTHFRYRIDGVLRAAMGPIEEIYHDPLISRIKVMSDLDITEHQVPQDGRMRLTIDHRPVDFRVSILPGIENEEVVVRVLDSQSIPTGGDGLRLRDLGLNDRAVTQLKKIITNPSGMVVVAGPTGSGKTTTLYAALNEIDHKEGKTVTIEDPVEYRLKGVLQVPVNEKKKLTFSKGLRSILRHDPDRIMVGEIRDKETAEIAVQSSLTGHLLLTTIHANTELDVLNRFTHMGIKIEELASSLACVVSQRLVRKICPTCKVEVPVDVFLLEEIGASNKETERLTVYEGEGCEACGNTGYRGRVAITEVMKVTPWIAEDMINKVSMQTIREKAKNNGMITLLDDAMEKVSEGITSIREIRRVLGSK